MSLKICISLWYFTLITPSITHAIMCYVCGQTNLKPPGECTTQFQYDCSTISSSTSQKGSKLFCRTTRSKIGENVFSVGKECISEHEHLTRYPDGKVSGCDTLDKNGSHELNYCICDRNLCNAKNIDDQINDYRQQQQQQRIIANPVRVVLPTDGINVSIGAWPSTPLSSGLEPSTSHLLNESFVQGQSVPDPPRFPNVTIVDSYEEKGPKQQGTIETVPNQQRTIETVTKQQKNIETVPRTIETITVNSMQIQIQPSGVVFAGRKTNVDESKIVSTKSSNILNVQTVETHHGIIGTESPKILQPFFCSTCSETNVSSATNECKEQVDVDCRKIYPGEDDLFCLTKGTILNGQRVIEKRCASRQSVPHELSLTFYHDGCNQTSISSAVPFQYCFCSTNKCNNISIAEQIGYYKSPQNSPELGNKSNITASRLICFSCSEANLNRDSDCSRQYENDCKSQDPTKSDNKMHCLTRQTKLASGLFSIEKRCISELEHRQQHPGIEVVLNGCSTAMNGDEQYCICETTFCNKQNMLSQKENGKNEIKVGIQTISQQITVFPPITVNVNGRSTSTSSTDQNHNPFKSLNKSDLTVSANLADQSKKQSNKQVSDKNSDSSTSSSIRSFQTIFLVSVLSFVLCL